MGSFKVKQNSLTKARNRYEKVSRRSKEFQIKFERTQTKSGSFITKPKIVRENKEYHYQKAGILHSIDYAAKYKIQGDKPSITRSINNWKPISKKGQAAKFALKATNFAAHDIGKTGFHIGLAAETTGIKSGRLIGDAAANYIGNKAAMKMRFSSNDTMKSAYFSGKIAASAAKGIVYHLKAKKQFKLENAKYKLQKAEYKTFKRSSYKLQKKEIKKDFKKIKKKFKASKTAYKNSEKTNINKALLSYRREQFKQKKSEIINEKKALNSKLRFMAKEKRNQWRIKDLSRPTPLAIKPLSSGVKQMKASTWQKAVYTDDRNDTLKAVNAAKRTASYLARHRKSKLQKKQIKRDKLANKSADSKVKLSNKEQKLKNKSSLLSQKWKTKNKAQKKFKEKARKAEKQAFRVASIPLKFFMTYMSSILFVLLIVIMVLTLFNGVIQSIFGNSGWVMGTYTSQDKYLSQAEEYYTKLAYNMNKNIITIGTKEKWREGLESFGIDTRGMTDDPDTWVWGQSGEFNYVPTYDFDTFKLWSFLCAYYYSFDEDSEAAAYWKYDSDTEDIIKELFEDEYEFEHLYDNESRWEELVNYNYFGGGSAETGTYYRAEKTAYKSDSGTDWAYKFKPISVTSELGQFKDSDGYIYINSNYRVLDPNDDFARTGYMVMDHRYYSDSAHSVAPFYFQETSTGKFYFNHGGEKHYRSSWGWSGDEAWFFVSPTDTHIWNDTLNDECVYGYYEKYVWKTDCRLYYNVKQKKTFDECIKDELKAMDNGNERFDMYEMFLGVAEDSKTTRGNHQTYHNVLDGDIESYIENGKILNGFGYDMKEWNKNHCAVQRDGHSHQAIDIACNVGDKVYAAIDGEITDIDTDNDYLKIRINDYDYWYDGDGYGKKRDTEIYYYNVLPGVEKGDKVKKGDIIGYVSNRKYCDSIDNTSESEYYIHIRAEIDTDGIGWDFVDPLLLLE